MLKTCKKAQNNYKKVQTDYKNGKTATDKKIMTKRQLQSDTKQVKNESKELLYTVCVSCYYVGEVLGPFACLCPMAPCLIICLCFWLFHLVNAHVCIQHIVYLLHIYTPPFYFDCPNSNCEMYALLYIGYWEIPTMQPKCSVSRCTCIMLSALSLCSQYFAKLSIQHTVSLLKLLASTLTDPLLSFLPVTLHADNSLPACCCLQHSQWFCCLVTVNNISA